MTRTWEDLFKVEFEKPYFKQLDSFIKAERREGKVIFPPEELVFNAFKVTPLDKVKVVIIGQDVYFNEGQAHGLSFSVQDGVKHPPSLKNIFKELESTIDFTRPDSGNLTKWANQGALMLNAALTVESGLAGSHLKKGWMILTKAVIEHINQNCTDIVFLAWGGFAHKVCLDVDTSKHSVIKTSHPSPLGALKVMKTAPAFLGSDCFNRVNEELISHNQTPIDWELV